MTAGTMRAAVYHGPHDVRIEERPIPGRRTGHVLMKVLRSGMCGTDGSEWRDGPHLFPSTTPHPVTGVAGPFVMGHEFIGVVVEADEAGTFAVGARVACGAGVSCGECPRCREGRTNLCFRYHTHGLNEDGGMAEYVAVPAGILTPIPDALATDAAGLNAAGLAQPLAVGMHAARRSGAADGDKVVLIGAGAIGTFVLAGLLAQHDVEVTVVDFAGPRLERAKRVGAARTVGVGDTTIEDVAAVVGGRGADVVIEASGAPGQLANAIRMARPGGTILQVGLPSRAAEIDLHSLVVREISIRTTNAHVFAEDLAPALELLASSRLAEELLDSVRPLTDLPEQLELLATGRLEGKVLFDPSL
jgi:(R,R)-butanediol dehydrogenase/meso-butanediol dehydrogenase/diacetyl reductase